MPKKADSYLLSSDFIKNYRSNNKIISVSPSFNIALGGQGIPMGTWMTISAVPKLGKSSLALWIAKKAQEQIGSDVYYFNIEGRIKPRDFEGVPGLDLNKLFVIQSTPGNIKSAQVFLTEAEKILHEKEECVVILDSYSSLSTENELTSGIETMERAQGPKLLSKFMRRMSNVVPINRNMVIGILHVYANVTGYGAAKIESGGWGVKYQSDLRLCGIKSTPLIETNGNFKKQVGQKVEWKVETSPIGPPGGSVVQYLKYGSSFDEAEEILDLALDWGLISVAGGGWHQLDFSQNGEVKKLQGRPNTIRYLRDNPNLYTDLYQKIYNLCMPMTSQEKNTD